MAMLIAAYRKILRHDFIRKSQGMSIPQGKALLSCLAGPLTINVLAFGSSAYAGTSIYVAEPGTVPSEVVEEQNDTGTYVAEQ